MVRLQVWHNLIICTCFFVACNTNSINDTDRKKLAADSIYTRFKQQAALYTDWLSIYKQKDTSFTLDSFSYVSQYNNDFIYTLAKLQKDYFKKYSRLFIYSLDSDKFIDPFSSNIIMHIDKNGRVRYKKTEVEQEVAVVDMHTNKRYRIFFCGSPCFVSHAAWVTNDKIALMGVTTDEDNSLYTPTIWFIDMKKNATAEYSYTNAMPGITPAMLLDSVLYAKGIPKMN